MIELIREAGKCENIVILVNEPDEIKGYDILTENECDFALKLFKETKRTLAGFNRLDHYIFIQKPCIDKILYKQLEYYRKEGDKLCKQLNMNREKQIIIIDKCKEFRYTLAFAEGMVLGNYRFLKYKTSGSAEAPTLKNVSIISDSIRKSDIDELNILIESVFFCRDLVNEPLSALTAEKFAKRISTMCTEAGAMADVLNKTKIESLKMGGLLGVNKGSPEPPTFTVLEWKPAHHVNRKPWVIVGKGIVYDTGGISLKPSSSMETMKSDMAGGAATAACIYALAKAGLPVHVIGLVPATENRPDGNAYVPGDIIKISDGTNVEVTNTDAEGRLILADALVYAKKYKPGLVIDIATLTGSASAAIGRVGMVGFQADAFHDMELMKECGNMVYERIAEFPFWDEYADMIKSDIADIKNTGGREAGAITAAKFLQHFTDYPFIHLDIAGPAFLEKPDSYRGTGATGVTVRLLFDFFKNKCRRNI